MADDAAGAVRRTPRPAAKPPTAWWSPTEGFWTTNDGPVDGLRVLDFADEFRAYPPNDAVQLVGPDQRRPVVLLRADDCDCGPPYADCLHGPEPVDALDLAVWLHAEARWRSEQTQRELARLYSHHHDFVAQAAAERDALQARLDAVRTVLDRPWPDDEDHHDFVNGQVEAARAALQGDQPTEPRHELILKSGLSGCTGACSCGTWHGGGRHEPPSRVAYRWDAEHLTSLPLEQPTGEADRG